MRYLNSMRIKIIRGFTLIELMVTILVLGIFMAIAMPDFTAVIENDSITNMSNDLITSLNMARSEAIKRDVPVSVCATADNTYSSCGANWDLGWIVFVNPTGGSVLSNTAAAPLLRTIAVTNQNATISTAPAVDIITYNGSGFTATSSSNVTFTVKATGCTTDSGRSIALNAVGHPVVTNISCP